MAGALSAELLEGFEETADFAFGYDRSAVHNREEWQPGASPGGHQDLPVVVVMAVGVLDEVGDEPLREVGVADGGSGGDVGPDLEPAAPGAVERALGEDLPGDGGEVEGFLFAEAAFAAGQGKERVDELFLVGARHEELFANAPEAIEGETGPLRRAGHLPELAWEQALTANWDSTCTPVRPA